MITPQQAGCLSSPVIVEHFCKMLHPTPVSLTMGLDFGPFSTGTWRDQLQSPWLPVAKRSRKAGLKSATLLVLEAPPPEGMNINNTSKHQTDKAKNTPARDPKQGGR